MSKKYMRIYCNGIKIRSTGSSMKDIHRTLQDFGCCDIDNIISVYQDTDMLRPMNTLDWNGSHIGGILIPIGLTPMAENIIRDLVLYLYNQSNLARVSNDNPMHQSFIFSMEIIKKRKNTKQIIDCFDLPIGISIQRLSNGLYIIELVIHRKLSGLHCNVWKKYINREWEDKTMIKQLINNHFGLNSVNGMTDTDNKREPLMLKSINPFVFIKEHVDSSYIIGRFIYEQEPCQVTIDYVVDEHISLDELVGLMNDTLIDLDIYDRISQKELLYIPYSVFELYMYDRIDNYVDSGKYREYNDTLIGHESIYRYKYIVIDLIK